MKAQWASLIRVQVVMIAFCFGALLEALAGFGMRGAEHFRRHGSSPSRCAESFLTEAGPASGMICYVGPWAQPRLSLSV
jgi:hypothetical protein